ncbi:sigma-70 family RNA polymerase sigma factor [Flavivirga spongiicola]|uniref:Sigma-70 family RNA polymerase sigma factor n=1 Tax=Flavivirga spongiicola TaxID=421621 RepID=A0ABU7XPZ0_9FLAO|nr:sigma-70 family RNA polymerase sigma factor [Flavivirga sp. MEBiC05379]MDO5977503.1 sigma-70 family RNA polymerase sigma factor [Flavivirga sp. MEBiC05379]
MQNQVTQLYNPLLGYVKKRVRNLEDAEDLTQDVFLKLSKSNNNGVDNLKSWVYTIAKNTITDYYRKKQLQTNTIEEDRFFDSETNEGAGMELSKCVNSFINQLPEEYIELMTLSELKEIPQKEIAERLDMNYVTVRSKIQRGRKKLKKLFEDCCTILQGGKGSILDFQSKDACDNQSSCS